MRALRLRISGEWPPSKESESTNLMLLVSVYEKTDALTPGFDPRSAEYPHIIDRGERLLASVSELAFRDGYVARVDVSRAEESVSPWPRWCLRTEQFKSMLHEFACRSRYSPDDMLSVYPITVSLIPEMSPRTEKLLELWRQLPFDRDIGQQAFASGLVRYSISDAFCDIVAGDAYGARVMSWLVSVRTALGDELVWDVEVADES